MHVGMDLLPTGGMTSAAGRKHDVRRGNGGGGERRSGGERKDPSLDFKESITSGMSMAMLTYYLY